MPNIIKDQDGTHPLVFKRVDATETKIRPIEINKRFFLPSGSNANSGNPHDKEPDFMSLYANYEPSLMIINPFNSEVSRFDSPEVHDFYQNTNGMYAFNVYNSINHLFYKYKHDALKSHGRVTPDDKSTKILFQSASVFSIPQKKMGLKCKVGSFYFSGSKNLESDEYDNIIDSKINTSGFAPDPIFYEGFNEYFDKTRITRYESTEGIDFIPGVVSSLGTSIGAA